MVVIVNITKGVKRPLITPIALLCAACERNCEKLCSCLVEKGMVNINASAPGDRTPLVCATREGHTRIAKMLISFGADPDIRVGPTGKQVTALYYAVARADSDLCKLFLAVGASIERAAPGGLNALLELAVDISFLETCRVLLAKTYGISNSGDDSLLEICKQKGHTMMIPLIEQHIEQETANCAPSPTPLNETTMAVEVEATESVLQATAACQPAQDDS